MDVDHTVYSFPEISKLMFYLKEINIVMYKLIIVMSDSSGM